MARASVSSLLPVVDHVLFAEVVVSKVKSSVLTNMDDVALL